MNPQEPLDLQGKDALSIAGEGAKDPAPQDAGGGGRFGGLSAKEAAARRWAKERERESVSTQALAANADQDTRLVLVPVSVGAIITRLDKDAQKGSTQAARELRAWLEQYPPQDDAFDPAAMDTKLRGRMYAWLAYVLEDQSRWEAIEGLLSPSIP